jgi:hypothetical protein
LVSTKTEKALAYFWRFLQLMKCYKKKDSIFLVGVTSSDMTLQSSRLVGSEVTNGTQTDSYNLKRNSCVPLDMRSSVWDQWA